MHTSDDVTFRKYLRQIEECLGGEAHRILDKVDRSKKVFSAQDLIQISLNLEVDAVNLWQCRLDLEALRDRIVLKGDGVPTRYLQASHSSTTTLKNVVALLDRYNLGDYVLRKMQVPRAYISQHRKFSITGASDAFGCVADKLPADAALFTGDLNGQAFWRLGYKNLFRPSFGSKKVFEVAVENTSFVERNWDYQILKNDLQESIFETWISPEMLDAKVGERFNNFYVNNIRRGFFRTIMRLNGYEVEKSYYTPGTLSRPGAIRLHLHYATRRSLTPQLSQ